MSAMPVVIFMTSNGVGMGHLSRQLTIALSGPARFDSVIFSLSGALPRVIAADRLGELPEAHTRGLGYEHCPSRQTGWLPAKGWQRMLREGYPSYRWHPYLRDRLAALAGETGASTVVFDGVVPYEGLLQARSLLPHVRFVWMRRGMWQPDAPTHRLGLTQEFDLAIQPGDFGSGADRGPLAGRSDAHHIPPVSLVDVLTPSTRETARRTLGLPLDRPVLLLAPGSGALGSVEEATARIVKEVALRGPEWVVAVTRQSIVAHDIGLASDSIAVLDDVYPLARHLSAFDAAVSAAGYNSVHELLGAQIPTLFVPSVHHETDDQLARARGVVARGAALLPPEDRLEDAVTEVLSEETRNRLRSRCADLETARGGAAAAELVGALADEGMPSPGIPCIAQPQPPWVDARTPVAVGGDQTLFTEQISVADLRGERPIEHLIQGSSAPYREARRRTAAWLYRPRGETEA